MLSEKGWGTGGVLLFCLGRTEQARGKSGMGGSSRAFRIDQKGNSQRQGHTWCVQGIGRRSMWLKEDELRGECGTGSQRGRGWAADR